MHTTGAGETRAVANAVCPANGGLVKAVESWASFAVALVTGAPGRTSPAWPGLFGRADQRGEHVAERGVDFDVGERVGTSRASVDDRHRDPRLLSAVHEPQP